MFTVKPPRVDSPLLNSWMLRIDAKVFQLDSKLAKLKLSELTDVSAVVGGPATDQVLQWNGTVWLPGTVSGGGGGGSGDITAVVAGNGLTGGATSGSATLNVVGSTGITVTANDISIDTSVVTTLAGTQTLTNKTLTSPVINTGVSGTAIDTDLTSTSASDDTLASAKAIKTYADTKLSNIVEDTSPQLGGTLDANSNTIDMGTNTITDTKVGNWDTAHGWGNHASAGYLTSQTSHADVVVDGDFSSNGIMTRTGAGSYAMLTDNSSNWNTAHGWGNHASAGYLTSLGTAIVDADFSSNGLMKRTGAGAYSIVTDNSSNWDTAFSWGNHASGGYQAALTFGIADTNAVKIDSASVADDEYARFTANGLESRSTSEVISDIGAIDTGGTGLTKVGSTLAVNASQTQITSVGTIGTGIWQGTAIGDTYISSASTWNAKQDALTFGIANTNAVKIDDADAADDDYAKLTASGIEGRSYAEVKTDLSLNNVENTALSTWAGTTNITTLGAATATSLAVGDDNNLGVGNSTDLYLAHYSSTNNSFLTNQGAGDLLIQNVTDNKDVIIRSDNGSGGTAIYFRAQGISGEAQLFHYGNTKLTTKTDGVEITGNLDINSGASNSLNLFIGDEIATPTAPTVATANVNGAVSNSTTLVVDGNSGTIETWMTVSGTGVDEGVLVNTVTDQNNLVLNIAQTISNDVALTFTGREGTQNTIVGTGLTGNAVTTGYKNVILGNNAGHALTTGTQHVLIGDDAGSGVAESINSTMIGWDAGQGSNMNWSTLIGSQTWSFNSYGTAVGGFAYTGYMGAGMGYNSEAGDYGVSIGAYAGQASTQGNDYNTLVGYAAGQDMNANAMNCFFGYYAGRYGANGSTSNAHYNVGIGPYTLYYNNSAVNDQNVAIGYAALYRSGGSSDNIAIGFQSMRGNSANNSFITGDSNVALGTNTLYGVSGVDLSGNYNVALGRSAGYSMGAGHYNILIGANAGDSITSGSGNIIMGYSADSSSATAHGELVIRGHDSTNYVKWINGDNNSVTLNYNSSGTASAKLATSNTGVDITGDLTLTSTDAGSSDSPTLALKRDSSSPATWDDIGEIEWLGENSASEEIRYAHIKTQIVSPTDGAEESRMVFSIFNDGADKEMMFLDSYQGGGVMYLTSGIDILFEGATANGYETTLTVADPTADRTITLPDATGTVLTTGNSDTPTTTTSSSDADYVLVDDGGVMKKITPGNLGIGGGGGSTAADDLTVGDGEVTLATTSGHIYIDAQANDTDIIFKGTDNNTDITALRLDMSDNGHATFSGDITGLESDLTLISTNAGGSDWPFLTLYRDSASPYSNDELGNVRFRGNNNVGSSELYASIEARLRAVTDGAEDGELEIHVMEDGSKTEYMSFDGFLGYIDVSRKIDMKRNDIQSIGNLLFEGATHDGNDTTLTVVDPTADRTITFPDATGTVIINESGTVNISSTANDGPILNLISNDHSDATDWNTEGQIKFSADNDADQQTEYASIRLSTADVTDGTEDGWLYVYNRYNGTMASNLAFSANGSFYLLSNSVNDPFIEWNKTGGTNYDVQLKTATPTADRTITLPDATGTVITTGNTSAVTSVGTLAGLTVGGNLNVNPRIFVESSGGYGSIEIGGTSGGFIDIKTPNSDDFDFRLIHDGTNSDIKADLLALKTVNNEKYILCTKDGSVDLYYNNVKTFETTSTGVDITGNLTLTSTDAGATADPIVELYRNSASPADGDVLGEIHFFGNDTDGTKTKYAEIKSIAGSDDQGNERGQLQFNIVQNSIEDSQYINMGFNGIQFFKPLTMTHPQGIYFEGSTNDTNETQLTAADPSQDNTITLPNTTGTVMTSLYADYYDSAGGTNVDSGAGVALNQTRIESDASVFSLAGGNNAGQVTVDFAGKFMINYDCTTRITSGGGTSRSETKVVLQEYNGSSWSDIAGTVSYIYNRTQNVGEQTSNCTIIHTVTSGYKYRIWADRENGTSAVTTTANGSRLTFMLVGV